MASTTTETSAKLYFVMKGIAYTLFAFGLTLSVTHIFDWFHHDLGASLATAAAMPFFIDGFQLVGRIIRTDHFAKETRKVGWMLQSLGAAASLAANMISADTVGDRIGGAVLVLGYITIEAVADVTRPATDDDKADEQAAADALAAKRKASAAKGAATRAANKAKAAKPGTTKQRANAKTARQTRQLANQIDAPLAADTRAYI